MDHLKANDMNKDMLWQTKMQVVRQSVLISHNFTN